jgi:hypothetical protein
MYVLVKTDAPRAGQYVARAGSHSSYTKRLESARTFPSREEAERDACENERAAAVSALVGRE